MDVGNHLATTEDRQAAKHRMLTDNDEKKTAAIETFWEISKTEKESKERQKKLHK